MATALDSYAELESAIANWTHRSDLSSVIPQFIVLAEERMNEVLRTRQMEVALAETVIADARIAVPTNTVAVKTVYPIGYSASPVSMRPYDQVIQLGNRGIPTSMAWQGDYFYFDGAGSVAGVLYQRISAITASAGNWVLDAYPSAYLSGALAEAFEYVEDIALADRWRNRFEATLKSINGKAVRDQLSGRLEVRAR